MNPHLNDHPLVIVCNNSEREVQAQTLADRLGVALLLNQDVRQLREPAQVLLFDELGLYSPSSSNNNTCAGSRS